MKPDAWHAGCLEVGGRGLQLFRFNPSFRPVSERHDSILTWSAPANRLRKPPLGSPKLATAQEVEPEDPASILSPLAARDRH